MSRRILGIMLLTLWAGWGQAQPLFGTPHGHFTTDNQGNVYSWQDASLTKYSPAGELLRVYGNPMYGNISSVDAGVVKTLAFYRESGKIVLLDNTLTPIGNELDLFEHGLGTISLATLFGNNKIALFDETNQDLYITDLNLNTEAKTHCSLAGEIAPHSLLTVPDQNIILADSALGVFLFDRFGTFERRLPMTGVISARLSKGILILLKTDNTLYLYNPKSPGSSRTRTCPIPMGREACLSGMRLYVLDRDGILHEIQE